MQLHIPHQCSKRMNEFAIQQYSHRFSKIRVFLEIFWTFKFNNNVFLRENEKIFMRRWTHSIFLLFLSLISKSESVKFSLIESVICLITDSILKTIFFTVKSVYFRYWISYFSLSNQ